MTPNMITVLKNAMGIIHLVGPYKAVLNLVRSMQEIKYQFHSVYHIFILSRLIDQLVHVAVIYCFIVDLSVICSSKENQMKIQITISLSRTT